MVIASRASRVMHRLAAFKFRLEDERYSPVITWGTTIINSPPLPCPDFQTWAPALEVTVCVLDSDEEVHEVRLCYDCWSRVSSKTLLLYLDIHFRLPI